MGINLRIAALAIARRIAALILALSCILVTQPVNASTLTFDDVPSQWIGTIGGLSNYFDTQGYRVITSGGLYGSAVMIGGVISCNPACPYNGTNYLFSWRFSSPYTYSGFSLSALDGNTFDLLGFDAAEANIGDSVRADGIQIFGYKADGTTVRDSFGLDLINDGDGPLVDFQTYTAPENMRGLSAVFVSGVGASNSTNGFSVDNIRLGPASPVPAPPATILTLTGLGLLGLSRRFRKLGRQL